jgi:gliding motility-associated-like protein
MKILSITISLLIIQIINSYNIAQVPTNGLIAFYPFSGNAKDASGNQNHGTNYGATLTYDRCSNPDSAYSFDGNSNYILINNSTSLNPKTGISLCAWIKPVAFTGSGNNAIISKGYYSHNSPYFQYHLGITGNLRDRGTASLGMSLSINNISSIIGFENSWTPGNWYFVVGTFDGNHMKLYINSNLKIDTLITGSLSDYGQPLCIAKMNNANLYTPGTIDDVRIYNRALTLTEIRNLYNIKCSLGAINGIFEVCPSQKNVNYFINSVSNATNYSWTYSGTGATITANSNSISINFSDNATSGNLSVTVTGSDFSTQTATSYITVKPLPSGAGAISGANEVCSNQNGVNFSIPIINNATSYIWNYSGTGASIIGSSDKIYINFSQNATKGNLTVTGTNSCGNGAVSPEFPIKITPPPSNAGIIKGLHEVCSNSAGIPFNIPVINNADNYVWNYSGTGATLLGSKDSISIYFFNNATSGNLSVYGNNICGNGVKSQDFPIIVKTCSEGSVNNINIPNAFSPNGDGTNDLFIIKGLVENTKVMIFDRLGKILFESDNYLNNWDGKDKVGNTLESGTYWYVISVPGMPSEFKGFVYLKK